LKGLFGHLYPVFHPADIANLISHPAVQEKQEVHRIDTAISVPFNEGKNQRSGRIDQQIRMEVPRSLGSVLEWIFLDCGIEQEIEGVEGGQIRDEIHFDREFARLFREKYARLPIRGRIELPA
jgi:hypothetical protein